MYNAKNVSYATALMLMLCACGGTDQAQVDNSKAEPTAKSTLTEAKDNFQKGWKIGTEKTIRDNWRKNFLSSCVSSAVATGAPEFAATPLCQCTADKLETRLSVEQMKSPANDTSQATVQTASNECIAELGSELKAKIEAEKAK